MKNQLCFLPDAVSQLERCEHDISSAVLRADQSLAARIKGQTVELKSVPKGVQQITLCKDGLWCLDNAGFVHRFNNREHNQRWTRGHSWPNDSPIESIYCFNDGSLCASTHDASVFVFQTNENKWLPQDSHFKRAPVEAQDTVQPVAAKPRAKQRFRFSLRTLMLLVLALALLLGPVNYLRNCFKTRMAINILSAQGHDIQFAHQFDANGKAIANAASPEPKWLDSLFGPRLLHRPITFQQVGDGWDPAEVDLNSLSKMTTLQELVIKGRKVSDLSFIENLKQLKVLKFEFSMDADLTTAGSLSNLEVLEIPWYPNHHDITPISQCMNLRDLKVRCKDTNQLQQIIAPLKKLERLNSNARTLDLDWVKHHLGLKSLKLTGKGVVTDFSPLMQLKQLEELELPILSSPEVDIELVPFEPFDFALLKQAPNLTVERIKLNTGNYPEYPNGSPHGHHIATPKALQLHLTNADSIPKCASITTLKTVRLNKQISDLTPLKGASLDSISGPGSQVKNLEALKGMPLQSVNFNQTLVSDISPVANKRLDKLKIDDTAVSDLPLNGLTALTHLSASNTPIEDISMLTVARVGSLDISGTQVHDLPALGKFLYELNISNTPVSKLPVFKHLNKLNMDHTSIKDIQTVSRMTALYQLSLKGTTVSDLSPAIGLKHLEYIDASDTKVERIVDFESYYVKLDRTKVTDLSPLAGSSKLFVLSVSGTPVTDLSPLIGVKRLSGLDISYTPVTDLSPILKMELTSLDLSGIKTTDLSVLAKLPKLCYLKLADLPLERIPALHPKMSLRELDLGETQIKDLSPLFNQKDLYSLVLPASADFSQDMLDYWPQLNKLVIGNKVVFDKFAKNDHVNPLDRDYGYENE